jgi:hypothetical protein
MSEDFRGVASRVFRTVCERLIHDIHHLGVAIMPAICERMAWIALLTVAVFIAFIAVQVLLSEAAQ